MRPVLLLAPSAEDPTVCALGEALSRRGGRPVAVATRGTLEIALDLAEPAASTVGGLAAGELAAAFVRTLPPRFGLDPDNPRAPQEHEAFLARQAAADGARDAVCALLGWLARQGRPVLNPPIGGTFLQNKLDHLLLARELGLRVPDGGWASRADGAVGFAERRAKDRAEVVDKPVRGGGYAAVVQGPRAHPARLYQARVEGRPVRVVLLDGQVLSAVAIEGTSTLDPRADPVWQRGEATYAPVDLDEDTARRLQSLAGRLGLRLCGVDLVEGPEGPVFLEANAGPIWIEQEEKTGHPITDLVADALLTPG